VNTVNVAISIDLSRLYPSQDNYYIIVVFIRQLIR